MKEAEGTSPSDFSERTLEKTPAPAVREKLGGSIGWKAKTAKRREVNACKPSHHARTSR